MNKTVIMRLIAVAALPFIIVGCITTPLAVAPPVTSAQLSMIRDQYRKNDPEARVGVVTAVLPSAHLASVGSVPTKDFSVGDVISFVDSNQVLLTMGHVDAINQNLVIVKYDTPDPAKREPVQGDMAVRAIH
ncbi:MAG TPA: hypothetical protein VGG44_08465 [Tepidisphaeraceae bacterium]